MYIYMIFNVVVRFFDSRYKVSLTWASNPRPSDFRSDARNQRNKHGEKYRNFN